MAKEPVTDRLTCQCAISYHVEQRANGRYVAVWDEEPPSLVQLCFGRCQRCGLPFHTEFTADEII
jgi:hypothetical protein